MAIFLGCDECRQSPFAAALRREHANTDQVLQFFLEGILVLSWHRIGSSMHRLGVWLKAAK
jgi:hypothetical protein